MMIAWLFIIAVLCMVIGHIFKVKRWGLFISVYEEPSEPTLLNAMTFGHTINTLLPVRLGDIVRVTWAGRKLKNGYSFSIATVIVDLYVDLITVGAMFFGLSLIGKGGERLLKMAYYYMWAFIIIIPLTILGIIFRRGIKKVIRVVASIFNEKIELRILYVSYLCIVSFKDIFQRINKARFILYSFGIWGGYVTSYVIFAEAVQRYGFFYTTSDVFTELFAGASIYHIEKKLIPFWSAYLLLPLAFCCCISIIGAKRNGNKTFEARAVLPQMNRGDRLAFLKTYYEEENKEHILAYLDINRDVTVLEDKSAGSNASTVLVMKPNGELFYRKYAFDKDGGKLKEQIDWIEMHQADIPLPIIVSQRNERNYLTYDMHSYINTTGLFRYIHTMPVEDSWEILRSALDMISFKLHTKNVRPSDETTIKRYIWDKVYNNLQIVIEEDKYIKALEQHDKIIVNGKELNPLKFYKEILSEIHLEEVFRGDNYADIHGDFTIENIICILDGSEINDVEYEGKIKPVTYYFIDPNTVNIHDSPFLDYAKLLQSLHGCYEFLMAVSSVSIDRNRVHYLITNSENYARLYNQYLGYLTEKYTKEQVRSIYYHEVIHWLRLMPYKIRKNEKLAVVFYTGLLQVLKDVWDYEKEQFD